MSVTAVIEQKSNIDNHTATKLARMAEKFYSNPENMRKYTEWHLQEYGCLPEGAGCPSSARRRNKNEGGGRV